MGATRQFPTAFVNTTGDSQTKSGAPHYFRCFITEPTATVRQGPTFVRTKLPSVEENVKTSFPLEGNVDVPVTTVSKPSPLLVLKSILQRKDVTAAHGVATNRHHGRRRSDDDGLVLQVHNPVVELSQGKLRHQWSPTPSTSLHV